MRTTKTMRSSLMAALALIAWSTVGGVAQATPAPVYGYAQVNVVEGLSLDEDSEHGAGPVHAEEGELCWFHSGSSGCGGLPSASLGAVSAWAEVSADAAAGSAALEVEAFSYGVPDPPYPQIPPYAE